MSHHSSSLVSELAGVRSRVAEMVDTLWAAHDGDELMDVVSEVEALKSTLDALSLGVVRELEATDVVKGAGWASTQDFLTHTCGGHKGIGPALVRLAAATAEPGVAPVAEALRDGWLSTAKAHVIERAVDRLPSSAHVRARGVQVLLADAKRLDASELKKVAMHLVTVVDPEGDERRDERALDRLERAAHLGRHLSITDDQAGGAWIKGRCSTEDAAMIKATLIPLAAPQPLDDGERDLRDHGARMLDALTEACRRLQSTERASRVPRCDTATDPDDGLPAAPRPLRPRRHRDRRTALRLRRTPPVLRRRGHPRRPRWAVPGPRRRPAACAWPRSPSGRPLSPATALPLRHTAPARR